mmetsp:Transcript_43096/g.49674  ORF Transcript_43096/g.49674 Transcript_43096/m.49674 type:complete len:275 (+) Transcript_43096:79-903(+)
MISRCFSYHLLSLVLVLVISTTTKDNAVSCFSSFGIHNTKKSAAVITVSSSSSSSSLLSLSVPTLTEDTTWNMRMSLRNLPTKNGNKFPSTNDGIIFSIQAKFIDEINYEPPQGNLVQVISTTATATESIEEETDTNNDESSSSSSPSSSSPQSMQMKLISGSWKLSEDPEDQKDGLWIWGLFKEPLYPYLLLQMDIDSIVLPGNNNDDEILPFQLYAQIDHKRGGENNGEVILSQVSTINVRSKETMKADPFGAATLDYYEDTPAGQLQLQPL